MEKMINYQKVLTETLMLNDEIINVQDLKGKSIIFVVDMNNGFCKAGNLASPTINSIVPAIRNLLELAIANKIEVIALNDHHTSDNPEFKSYPPHCLAGSKESELVSELQFPEIKIIKKNSTNGFFVLDTNQRWTWENIIIVGCCTDICVYQLALNCKTWCNQQNQPINIFVPKTMTTTFDTPEHPSTLLNMIFWYSMLQNGIKIIKDVQ